jgi:uncharacterized protein YndB with AHSA1/START domain
MDLRLHRTLEAPVDRVWQALTDPAALTAWFWPERLAATVTAGDGRYRIASSAAGMAVAGEYREVDPPHRLGFTWQWDGDPDQTLVTIELTPSGDETVLTLVHSGCSTDADRDNLFKGWSDCLDRLPGWLASSGG